jgi:cytochrome c551/c552
MWVLWAALLFPAGFAGWAVGHYTSLGKSGVTVIRTVTQKSSTPSQTTTATTGAGTTSAATTGAATTGATTTTSTGGNAQAGKAVFLSNACGSCHTFKPAGTSGSIGPDLDTAPTLDAKRDNMGLAAFVKQSIVDPNAYVPKGYHSGLMPTTFGKQLSPKQLNDLVSFIIAGQK